MNKHIFPLCMIVLSLLGWLLVWDKLPASLPIHWGWNGEVANTSSVVGAFSLINGMLIGVYLMMMILPKISPRKKNHPSSAKTYYVVRDSIITLLFLISVGTIAICIGARVSTIMLVTTSSMGLLLTLLVILFLSLSSTLVMVMCCIYLKIHRIVGQVFLNKLFKEHQGGNK